MCRGASVGSMFLFCMSVATESVFANSVASFMVLVGRYSHIMTPIMSNVNRRIALRSPFVKVNQSRHIAVVVSVV